MGEAAPRSLCSRALDSCRMRADEGSNSMKKAIVVFVLATVCGLGVFSILAQAPAAAPQASASAPLQGGVVTAADLAAIVARQPKDRNGNQVFLQLAPYNVTMEHRVNV